MKNTLNLIIGLTALFLVAACGPSRYTNSNVNLASVPEYAFIEPYSYIVLYGDDGKGYYNEQSSAQATNIITNLINSERFPFSDMIPADYDDANSDIAKWLRTFPDVDPSKADRLRVPKSLKRMLDQSGLRYGIVIYSYGYVQTKAGYQREKVEKAASRVIDKTVEKLTGITGLTNPSQNYYVSDPYGNVLYCAVIDGETDRVIHFVNETPTFGSHPTENSYVSDLLHKLLKEFIR
ncbi:MAG: hypothetical protein IJJ72_02045 [Bacteroidales bacterium]|jgi:hypothetical protein|nr:hypothetical protein [Bacteroidales bacterium]MBR0499759.1 hypothetical protein [Bacteroidales bacterium]